MTETELDTFLTIIDTMTWDLSPALDLSFIAPPLNRPQRRRSWTQRDVTRAFRAASRAGVAIRIEIAPDGKLILTPIPGVSSTTHSNDADDIIAKLK